MLLLGLSLACTVLLRIRCSLVRCHRGDVQKDSLKVCASAPHPAFTSAVVYNVRVMLTGGVVEPGSNVPYSRSPMLDEGLV